MTMPSTTTTAALALFDRLAARDQHHVPEEIALLAARLNAHFAHCATCDDHVVLADALCEHNPAGLQALHAAIVEGEGVVHILLESLVHLSYSALGRKLIVDDGVIESLLGCLRLLDPLSRLLALQLLDDLTTGPHTVAMAACRRRLSTPMALRALHRVLVDVSRPPPTTTTVDAGDEDAGMPPNPVAKIISDPKCHTLVIALLDKITDELVTLHAAIAVAANARVTPTTAAVTATAATTSPATAVVNCHATTFEVLAAHPTAVDGTRGHQQPHAAAITALCHPHHQPPTRSHNRSSSGGLVGSAPMIAALESLAVALESSTAAVVAADERCVGCITHRIRVLVHGRRHRSHGPHDDATMDLSKGMIS